MVVPDGKNERFHGPLPNSESVVFGQSLHMLRLEEEDRYLGILRDFPRRVEGKEAR
jgi:hypothetical protein